jgi:hypothetical protein
MNQKKRSSETKPTKLSSLSLAVPAGPKAFGPAFRIQQTYHLNTSKTPFSQEI